ncbi:hypothetical protein [Geobacillus stearothermophilus]|uniref:Uncharacterized protein n=1 Tax=Geobacillus stearothermophilus TaxID=1422 RepID=A0A150MQ00_GEOSE|nr:hypothetical protein [Geobacillus stearothermophilus]KYD26543.1 hypothetical protein B4109_3162 [Geobacillus stearothermophilus]
MPLDLERLREWLISKGIPAEELDELIETPVIRDIGEGLTLSLINDENIGMDIVNLMIRLDELEQRVAQLEGGNA